MLKVRIRSKQEPILLAKPDSEQETIEEQASLSDDLVTMDFNQVKRTFIRWLRTMKPSHREKVLDGICDCPDVDQLLRTIDATARAVKGDYLKPQKGKG